MAYLGLLMNLLGGIFPCGLRKAVTFLRPLVFLAFDYYHVFGSTVHFAGHLLVWSLIWAWQQDVSSTLRCLSQGKDQHGLSTATGDDAV